MSLLDIMTKKDIQKRVLQNCEGLPLNKFEWNKKDKIFSTKENNLTLDFTDFCGILFNTGDNCRFKTSCDCKFNTGNNCVFETSGRCNFKTGENCMFYTVDCCTFVTGNYCNFDTNDSCIFITGNNCIFDTYNSCKFDTGNHCMFKISYDCTLETGENCTIMRKDTSEVIKVPKNKKIHLNYFEKKGYTFVSNRIIIDGKEIELSKENYNKIKKIIK